MYQQITYVVSDGVATITFNRSDAGNALTTQMQDEFVDAVGRAGRDAAVRVIVITGAGRNFCAGGDIKSFRDMLDRGEHLSAVHLGDNSILPRTMRACPKHIIAKVNGAAAGAGCSIALAADFRVMTPKSALIMAFIKMGLCGDTDGYYSLSRLIGLGRAAQIMATGERIGGEKAYEWGLANFLAPEEQLEETTAAFAAKLATGPTLAYGYQKKLANQFFYSELEAFAQGEGLGMQACSQSADFNEAVNAFLEKRAPKFQGK